MSGLLSRSMAWGLITATALLGACSSTSLTRAPVEDRQTAVSAPPRPVSDPRTEPVKQPSGLENAGKPGYYTVKPGDTLIRIGLENGQSYKDIRRWNAIEDPNRIEVGQILRIIPPVAVATEPVTRPVTSAPITTAALPPGVGVGARVASAASPVAGAASAASPAGVPASAASASASASATASSGATADDELGWIWPNGGTVIAGFDEVKNKGVDIAGSAGDSVLAAAEGKVVYAGAGLRGYGNLIILKHNNTYLSAYAHNRTLLVKEDQTVRRGQKIAEMGDSDADRVKLHFEVRKQGKPVDPIKYLPAR